MQHSVLERKGEQGAVCAYMRKMLVYKRRPKAYK
jgi:hypothetical protein